MEQVEGSEGEPSAYELEAWRSLRNLHLKGDRRLGAKHANEQAVVTRPSSNTGTSLEANSATRQSSTKDVGPFFEDSRQTIASFARLGLTPKGTARKLRRRGHGIATFSQTRSLDLEQVETARWRHLGFGYSLYAGVAGAGAGLLVTGGEFGLLSGYGAIPSVIVILSVFAADTAMMLVLSARATAHVALSYGYDPAEPTEKRFTAGVSKLAFAGSQGAKQAAWTELVRTSNLLGRRAPWSTLDKTLTARLAKSAANTLGLRLTKRQLGKIVPMVGVLVGAVTNFATLDRNVDAAILAYRMRFLTDKYPHLALELESPEASQLGEH